MLASNVQGSPQSDHGPRGRAASTAWVRRVRQMLPLLAAEVVLLLVFRYWVPTFLTSGNMLDLAQQISVNAIIAFGMTLAILIGGIDLSVGALLALVGTTTVYLLPTGDQGQSYSRLVGALVCGFLVAGLFGMFHGTATAYTRMPPFIVTLGTMLVARGCALRYNLGQPISIGDGQTAFLALGNGRVGPLPLPVIVMAAVFASMAVLLHRTRFGQYVYAIGGNREAARYTGVPLARTEISVYTIASLLTALAGMIHVSQLYAAEPGSGVGFELSAIAAAVVGGTSFTGGRGTMLGTLLGAVIIGTLDKGLNQTGVHFSSQYIVKGLVILGAVYLDIRRRGR